MFVAVNILNDREGRDCGTGRDEISMKAGRRVSTSPGNVSWTPPTTDRNGQNVLPAGMGWKEHVTTHHNSIVPLKGTFLKDGS
jgi:hypothetical protein